MNKKYQTLRGIISYNGSAFKGSALNALVTTVQGKINLLIKNWSKEEAFTIFASRTDHGVNAIGQSFTFELPICNIQLLKRYFNHFLKPDALIKHIEVVSPASNARLDCKVKIYQYIFLLNPQIQPSWYKGRFAPICTKQNIDEPFLIKLNEILFEFTQHQDVTAITNISKDNVHKQKTSNIFTAFAFCETDCLDNQFLILKFIGTHFQYKQIRNMVGLVLPYIKNSAKFCHQEYRNKIKEILSSKKKQQIQTVMPDGLYLVENVYCSD